MTIDEIIDSLKPQFDSEQYDYERLFSGVMRVCLAGLHID